MAESACLESTCAGNGTVGSNPTLSAIRSRAVVLKMEPSSQRMLSAEGGIRTGVLKGVFPLHGVTGAKRRREGAWPPSGSGAGCRAATSNSHPLRHKVRSRRIDNGAIASPKGCRGGGIRTGENMPKFMLAYCGGNEPGSQEEGMAQMEKWKAWIKGLGESIVNPGTPLPVSKIVTSSRVEDDHDPNSMKGFAVVKAQSMEAAVQIAQSDPFLESGGTIRVSQMMEMNE